MISKKRLAEQLSHLQTLTVPGSRGINLDIRSISPEKKEAAAKTVREQTDAICRRRKVPYTIEELNNDLTVTLEPCMVEFLSQCCQEQGKRYKQMPSGAGHDAMHWAEYTPTGYCSRLAKTVSVIIRMNPPRRKILPEQHRYWNKPSAIFAPEKNNFCKL